MLTGKAHTIGSSSRVHGRRAWCSASTSHSRRPRSLVQQHAALAPELGAAWKSGVYSLDMFVRDYELDQFNVVNNAVFSSYLQHARHEALAALGHDVDASARSGAPLALSELTLRFKAPLRSRDAFRVSVWVQKIGGARAVLGQQIELLPKPVAPAGHPAAKAAQAGGAQGDGSCQEGASLGGSASRQAPPAPQVVLTAEAVVVWLDSNYRPTRVPADVKASLTHLHNAWLQTQKLGHGHA